MTTPDVRKLIRISFSMHRVREILPMTSMIHSRTPIISRPLDVYT